jgi:hypothetical protein
MPRDKIARVYPDFVSWQQTAKIKYPFCRQFKSQKELTKYISKNYRPEDFLR